MKRKVLFAASVASMIEQFNMPNIRLLLEMGFEVHVACNFVDGNTCDMEVIHGLKQKMQRMGVILHQWDCPRTMCSYKCCRRAYQQIKKLAEETEAEVLHCHSPIGGALARKAVKNIGARKIKTIYTAHGFHFYDGAPLKNWILYYSAEKILSFWTDVLITVNREDYLFAKQHLYAKKIYYIPGVGVDTAKFAKTGKGIEKIQRKEFCAKYDIPEYAKILLSVGELSERKNHQEVIRAVADLSRHDVYYLICGQGKLEEQLKEQAKALNVEKYIRLVGFQKDVKTFYQNADIFVFPSRQEGMPVALMEAMAAGLACVVSDIRGNRELIDCRGGLRFALDRSETLACRLRQILNKEEFRMKCGRHNQVKIKSFDIRTVDYRMRKIYARELAMAAGGR